MNMRFDQPALAPIAKQYRLKFVILHGSYATGRARPDSDLDIAVVNNKKLSLAQLENLYGAFGKIFGDNHARELDLKSLYGADPLLRYEVARDGQLLYGDPTDYEDFKAVARRMYDDAEPLFALERVLIKKRQQHLNKLTAKYA